jgi:hypothetical protein
VSADHRPDPGLLAEYAEGLLEGTPEGGVVAARLADDPVWAAAYTELTGALAAVRAELAALGPAGPVPADVVTRLDAAVSAAGTGVGDVRPFRPRGRALAVAAAATAAAAVVIGFAVVAGLGGPVPSAPAVAVPPDRVGQTVITSTGTDYGTAAAAGTLGSATADGPRAADVPPAPDASRDTDGSRDTDAPFAATATGAVPPASGSAPIPAALTRLTSFPALAACLEAVRRLVGAGAPATRSADFGRFAGIPALVVLLAEDPSGHSQVLAVGPSCGAGGADLIARTGATP